MRSKHVVSNTSVRALKSNLRPCNLSGPHPNTLGMEKKSRRTLGLHVPGNGVDVGEDGYADALPICLSPISCD
jgi:hypothetical protein